MEKQENLSNQFFYDYNKGFLILVVIINPYD